MTAKEVHDIMDSRLSGHEEKCDQRQTEVYAKIDQVDRDVKTLSKWVYIGIGILIALDALGLAERLAH